MTAWGSPRRRTALALGECMIELLQTTPTSAEVGVAGDTYNTAVYLARVAALLDLPLEVGYLTGLGVDPYSEQIRLALATEGVVDRSIPVEGGRPGLYAVSTDVAGERSFTYWRRDSAAASLFSGTAWVAAVDADVLHFSGISLQLMSPRSRDAFLHQLVRFGERSGLVSFDTNYRPAGWERAQHALTALDDASSLADIMFVSVEDEQLLRGWSEPEEILRHYLRLGADEVVAKLGPQGVVVAEGSRRHLVHPRTDIRVLDTTAAGDSLAGGYLAARLAGRDPEAAAEIGVRVASEVIRWPGAIVPKEEFAIAGLVAGRQAGDASNGPFPRR